MGLEIDPKSVNGAKYRVAAAFSVITRPFMLNGSAEFVPGNITIKEVARVAGMDPNTVASVIDAKQPLPQSQSAKGCIVFSDQHGNDWNISKGRSGSKRHKKAARMAGHRGSYKGEKAAKATLKNMRDEFSRESIRVVLENGVPLERITHDITRQTSRRWTNKARVKIDESNRAVSYAIVKSGYYSRDPIQLEAEARALEGAF